MNHCLIETVCFVISCKNIRFYQPCFVCRYYILNVVAWSGEARMSILYTECCGVIRWSSYVDIIYWMLWCDLVELVCRYYILNVVGDIIYWMLLLDLVKLVCRYYVLNVVAWFGEARMSILYTKCCGLIWWSSYVDIIYWMLWLDLMKLVCRNYNWMLWLDLMKLVCRYYKLNVVAWSGEARMSILCTECCGLIW